MPPALRERKGERRSTSLRRRPRVCPSQPQGLEWPSQAALGQHRLACHRDTRNRSPWVAYASRGTFAACRRPPWLGEAYPEAQGAATPLVIGAESAATWLPQRPRCTEADRDESYACSSATLCGRCRFARWLRFHGEPNRSSPVRPAILCSCYSHLADCNESCNERIRTLFGRSARDRGSDRARAAGRSALDRSSDRDRRR